MINRYIPRQTYAIVTGYLNNQMTGLVAGATINDDNTIQLTFPKNNPFTDEQEVTLHIDDRTGIETFTQDLSVNRCSYKAVLQKCADESALAKPVEFELVYEHSIMVSYKAPNYDFPIDNRPEINLTETYLKDFIIPDEKEKENKLGVLSTMAIDRPHTTVMAFLSSKEDDIFLISHKGTLKSGFIKRDSSCLFAIDHRSSYHFEKKYEWNYTVLRGETFIIPRTNKIFEKIQKQFIEKNPWEELFFTDPNVEMFHIKPIEII